jgi:transposase InsO family protein
MERIEIDHIGPFPEDVYDNKHMLVMIDTFTRRVELYPCKNTTSYTSAWHLADFIFKYGPPKEVYSDNGAAFVEQTYNDLAKLTGMKVIHPRAGDKERTAIVERENKEARRHLNNLMNEKNLRDEIVQIILNNTDSIGWISAEYKKCHGKLIEELNIVEAKRVADALREKELNKGSAPIISKSSKAASTRER